MGYSKKDIMRDHRPEGENCDLPAICGGHAGGGNRTCIYWHCRLLDGHTKGRVSQREYTHNMLYFWYTSGHFETSYLPDQTVTRRFEQPEWSGCVFKSHSRHACMSACFYLCTGLTMGWSPIQAEMECNGTNWEGINNLLSCVQLPPSKQKSTKCESQGKQEISSFKYLWNRFKYSTTYTSSIYCIHNLCKTC